MSCDHVRAPRIGKVTHLVLLEVERQERREAPDIFRQLLKVVLVELCQKLNADTAAILPAVHVPVSVLRACSDSECSDMLLFCPQN